jgi:hypothetical protein
VNPTSPANRNAAFAYRLGGLRRIPCAGGQGIGMASHGIVASDSKISSPSVIAGPSSAITLIF